MHDASSRDAFLTLTSSPSEPQHFPKQVRVGIEFCRFHAPEPSWMSSEGPALSVARVKSCPLPMRRARRVAHIMGFIRACGAVARKDSLC